MENTNTQSHTSVEKPPKTQISVEETSNTQTSVEETPNIMPQSCVEENHNTQTCAEETPRAHPLRFQEPLPLDPKEFTDRLCRLPSQSGSLLGSPRRCNSPAVSAAARCRLQERNTINRLTKSVGDLSTSINQFNRSRTSSPGRPGSQGRPSSPSPNSNPSNDKKAKLKEAKEAKKVPSNVMLVTPWVTHLNTNKLVEQVKSGDILEFNTKLHHHWGIALIPKEKKATKDNVVLIHLAKDKSGHNRVIEQPLKEYLHAGITVRINNSRDVEKPPLPAGEVTNHAKKTLIQQNRVWKNSDKLVTFCRYGERPESQEMNDAARWGALSRCVELWNTITSNPNSANTTPTSSPKIRRKRTVSLNI